MAIMNMPNKFVLDITEAKTDFKQPEPPAI